MSDAGQVLEASREKEHAAIDLVEAVRPRTGYVGRQHLVAGDVLSLAQIQAQIPPRAREITPLQPAAEVDRVRRGGEVVAVGADEAAQRKALADAVAPVERPDADQRVSVDGVE